MEKLLKYENQLFIAFLFLHLIPVFLYSPFVTLDGPSHLYNSGLLAWMTDPDSLAKQFLSWNPYPEPNWSIQAFQFLLLHWLPPLLVEKCSLLLILITFIMGWRKLILYHQPQNAVLSWLFFPFLYNFTFCMGFFNFCLAISVWPWTMLALHNALDRNSSKDWIMLFFLWVVLYFSHLLVCLLVLGFSAIVVLLLLREKGWPYGKRIIAKGVLTSLPVLVLSLGFVLLKGSSGYRGEVNWLPFKEIWDQLHLSRPFIIYNFDAEVNWVKGYVPALLIFSVIGWKAPQSAPFSRTSAILLLCSLILVRLVPDTMASGGIITVRMVLIFFLCWLFWLSLRTWRAGLSIGMGLLSVVLSLTMLYRHHETRKELSATAQAWMQAGNLLPVNSILMPLNYSENWLHSNMPAYAGTVKRVFVLDNYEASAGHFPLIWRPEMDPEKSLGNFASSHTPCVDHRKFEAETKHYVSAVIMHFERSAEDSCGRIITDWLNQDFEKIDFPNEAGLQVFLKK